MNLTNTENILSKLIEMKNSGFGLSCVTCSRSDSSKNLAALLHLKNTFENSLEWTLKKSTPRTDEKV